jgi:hypothetical protein
MFVIQKEPVAPTLTFNPDKMEDQVSARSPESSPEAIENDTNEEMKTDGMTRKRFTIAASPFPTITS